MHTQRALPSLSHAGGEGLPRDPPGEASSGCPDSAGPGWEPGLGREAGHTPTSGGSPSAILEEAF